jgi:ATP-dependent protease ClpP protease subunit
VRNAAADEADVMLYDEIGFWGTEARTFVRDLAALDVSTINLHINSPGGNVFDGLAIANALRAHSARVITHVDALAASIASVIALAGDEVRMADNAFLMIHDPMTALYGNAAEMRDTATLLDKIGGSLVNEYVKKTGLTVDEVKQYMADETWFDATEAVDLGFADTIIETSAVTAAFDLSVYAHAPAALLSASTPAAPRPPQTIREFETQLREKLGLSHAAARAIAVGGFSPTSEPRDEDSSGDTLQPLADLASDLRQLISR